MASIRSTSCLRALQRQARALPKAQIGRRNFNTTRYTRVGLRGPDATPSTSVQPPAPNSSTPATDASPASAQGPAPSAAELQSLLKHVKGVESYSAYSVTEQLFKQCSAAADYSIPGAGEEDFEMPKTSEGEDLGVGKGWWHKDLHLNPTFSTWSQVTMLHMYLLSARFRCFSPSESTLYAQHLLDHFFYSAENRMITHHNMDARGTRNKYLKDLFIQWRGLLFAYDEGLVKGDAVMASAVWRNVFKAKGDVDVRGLAAIVGYMRYSLMEMDKVSDEALKVGQWKFSDPAEQCKLVQVKSPLWDEPIPKEIEEQALERAAESPMKA